MMVYLIFGISIYRLSPKEPANKIVLIFGLFVFIWFLLFLIFVRKELWGSPDLAWHYILYGIPMMCALFFHFSLALTRRAEKLKFIRFFIYLPAFLFALYGALKILFNIFPDSNNPFFSRFLDLGNTEVYIVMGITGFIIIETAAVLIALWGMKSLIKRERKQAFFFSTGFSVSFIVSIASYLSFQVYGGEIFLFIYLSVILILALLFWIGMARYRLLVPTPVLAVEEIRNSIGEIVFLTDRNLKIQSANRRMKEFLSQPDSGITGKNITDFAEIEKEDCEKIRDMSNSGINSYACRIRFKNDSEAQFSCAFF